jgi:hypothetical protein
MQNEVMPEQLSLAVNAKTSFTEIQMPARHVVINATPALTVATPAAMTARPMLSEQTLYLPTPAVSVSRHTMAPLITVSFAILTV